MTYLKVVKYLESFINYEKIPTWPYKESFKLKRLRHFLDILNNPQDCLSCIHIAGTKGKGSTCAFITYILRQAGFKVGLYTSPHLIDFRERIRILNPRPKTQDPRPDFEGMISQDELTDLVVRLKPLIEKYNKISKYGPLSFFEVYTSLAFIYFKEKKVDFAVLETGLGGRLDATNVVNPYVCAITPISYEHTQKLGSTLREIAVEKVGIIKNQKSLPVPALPAGRRQAGKTKNQKLMVISAPQEKEVREVIRFRCKDAGAKLYEVGKDIEYNKFKEQGLKVKGIFGEYSDLKINLLGRHQLINATVAMGVIEALKFYDINISIDAIRNGFYNTIWPGRCEIVSRNPLVVLDGAQNVASARALKETIKENFSSEGESVGDRKYKRLILVLGISQDKDIKGICNELQDLVDTVILTRANNPRACEPEILAQYFNGKAIQITNNVKEAKVQAGGLADKEDLILVCGSLFVVGEFRNGKV